MKLERRKDLSVPLHLIKLSFILIENMSILGKIVNGYATKKEVEAIKNDGGGQTGGGQTDNGTDDGFKIGFKFSFFTDDNQAHTGIVDFPGGTYLFKLATKNTEETLATGLVSCSDSSYVPVFANMKAATLEYDPAAGVDTNQSLVLFCKRGEGTSFDRLAFKMESLRLERSSYDSQVYYDELTRMILYNSSDEDMETPVAIIELSKLSINTIFYK